MSSRLQRSRHALPEVTPRNTSASFPYRNPEVAARWMSLPLFVFVTYMYQHQWSCMLSLRLGDSVFTIECRGRYPFTAQVRLIAIGEIFTRTTASIWGVPWPRPLIFKKSEPPLAPSVCAEPCEAGFYTGPYHSRDCLATFCVFQGF